MLRLPPRCGVPLSYCVQRVTAHMPRPSPGMKRLKRGITGQNWALMTKRRHCLSPALCPATRGSATADAGAGLWGKASPSEEKYLHGWQEMGFAPEVVALAYDRTMLRCHELKWPYLNGILKRWHKDGLHTLAEVQADKPAQKPQQVTTATPPSDEMRRYVQQLHGRKDDNHGL